METIDIIDGDLESKKMSHEEWEEQPISDGYNFTKYINQKKI